MKLTWMSLVSAGAMIVSGCAGGMEPLEDAEEADLGEAMGALVGENALSLNALSLNGLSAQNLQAVQDPGLAGQYSRQFMRYAVGCAFSSHMSFTIPWTDANGVVHQEKYQGELGLLDKWSEGPLDLAGQRIVSGCLAARVNLYGVPVEISVRSPQKSLKKITSSELASFPEVEGAFWGNLFVPQPYLYACYKSSTVSNSRAWQRACAAGYVSEDGTLGSCGPIHIAGACEDVCTTLKSPENFYPECKERPDLAGAAKVKEVITTALP